MNKNILLISRTNKLHYFLLIFHLFALTNSSSLYADGLACANTIEGNFIIFDNGKIIRQDHNHAQKYWVGSNFIVFVDYLSSLRVYHNDHAFEITNGISDITMDDSMFVWNIAGALRAWRQGQTYLINNYVSSFYQISEGTIAYIDDHERTLNVWYEGKTWVLDQNNMESPVTSLQLSSKTVAWQTPDYQFKLFIDGTIISKSIYEEKFEYSTGAGFCVLINPSTQNFEKLTIDGIYDLEISPAKWWASKYDKLIYLSWDNDLKIVTKDLTTTIANYKPDVFDFTVFGVYYNRLQQIFYFESQNNQIVLDYIPSYYYIFNRTFIYRDNSENVQVWDNGREYSVALSPSAIIEPMTDVIVITDAQKTSFWYKDRIYDFY